MAQPELGPATARSHAPLAVAQKPCVVPHLGRSRRIQLVSTTGRRRLPQPKVKRTLDLPAGEVHVPAPLVARVV